MVTVVDPNGTPAPVYTRSGVTLQTIAGNGSTLGSATPIVALSGHTIVIVETTNSPLDEAVVLPDDAQIGDLVEVYSKEDGGPGALVFPPSGEDIGQPASKRASQGGSGCLFRKVSATQWRFIHTSD